MPVALVAVAKASPFNRQTLLNIKGTIVPFFHFRRKKFIIVPPIKKINQYGTIQ